MDDYLFLFLVPVPVLVGVVGYILCRISLQSNDKRKGPENDPYQYTVPMMLEARCGATTTAAGTLSAAAIFVLSDAFDRLDALIFAGLFLLVAVVFSCQCAVYYSWKLQVDGEGVTLHRFMRGKKRFAFADVLYVISSDREATVYGVNRKKLFRFHLGKRTLNPAAYYLLAQLQALSAHSVERERQAMGARSA